MNTSAKIKTLVREVKKYYAKHRRSHLPWRQTHDPYKILVSELMLQQTQAARVIPKYESFIKEFPNWQMLARAKLSEVLKEWQGLGYNRRAKYLNDCAKLLSKNPKEDFASLPGVGPYTARAVAVFAFNKPEVMIETNIRTVFLYFCFTKKGTKVVEVADAEIMPLVTQALKSSRMQPRDFYAALMDYGAYLKGQGLRLNNRSKHYTRQSKFKGSTRELRGAILRQLLKKPATLSQLTKNLAQIRQLAEGEVERELKRLQTESLLTKKGDRWTVSHS